MRTALLFTLLIASSLAKTVYFCEVPVTVDDSVSVPQLHLEGSSYDWVNFNAISFNTFVSNSGDVEGRAAIRNTLNVKTYSFGYELFTSGVSALDIHLPDSLVVGGSATMTGGQTYPLGNGIPYPGALEGTFVGGTFTYSQTQVTRDTSSDAATVLSDFDNAQAYYTNLSAAFAALPVNGAYTNQYYTTTLTCPSGASTTVFSIPASDIKITTTWISDSCDDSAIIINVPGTDDVHFTGDNLNHRAESVVYNVQNSGRIIYVSGTTLNGGLLAPNNVLKQSSLNIGFIVAGDIPTVDQINRVDCQPPKTPDTPVTCVGYEASCTGTVNSVFSFLDMNVISFGSFVANTGDVEGRLAVAQNCVFGAGYSVGAALSTVNSIPDADVAYSLICGANLTWTSGALYPDGTNYLAPGNAEGAYVVGTTSAPADIAARTTQGSDLTSAFANAKACYEGFSSTLCGMSANTAYTVQYEGLFVTCNDAAATTYVLNVDGADISSTTYAVTSGCNFGAEWIINIGGSGDVELTGDTFPAIPGGVVYSVCGSGRTVNVHDIDLGGHVLAPDNTLNQASGVIVGKVVAGDITASSQINREDTCPDVVTVNKAVICSATAAAGVMTAQVYGAADFRVGDRTQYGEIVAIDGDYVTFDYPLVQGCSAGTQVATVALASNAGRGVYPNQDTSSASTVAVAAAAVAVAALMI